MRDLTPCVPEVGAECVNRACSDLCGGRSVMGVPTAIPLGPAAGKVFDTFRSDNEQSFFLHITPRSRSWTTRYLAAQSGVG